MRIKILIFFAWIITLVLWFTPKTALAKCAVLTTQEYRKQADIVLSGTATIVVGQDAFISVDKYYKGRGPETVRMTGNVSDKGVSSIDFKPEEGKKYLLFFKLTDTDELRTTACMGNKEIPDGVGAADTIALGKSKFTNPTPTPLQIFHSNYSVKKPALLVMILSGGIIFCLLLASFGKQKKRQKKKK